MKAGDMDLVREFAATRSESAFATLVERHAGLVYSAALRQVRDAQLAQEITQSVFILLANKAASLSPKTILPGWLYRTTRFVALSAGRREKRRRHLEQEASMEIANQNAETDSVWKQIAPLLDNVMDQLRDADRDAIVLRYFQNKSLQEVGTALGIEERAAQKRVVRALEKLRGLFARRGVVLTATGIAATISANAIQSAPVGVIAATTAGAAIAGSSAAITATKVIAMTTLQKAFVTTAVVAAIGTGVYEARQAANWSARAEALQRQQDNNANQLANLTRERDEAVAAQVGLRQDNERLSNAVAEMPKLRGDLARLRAQPHSAASTPGGSLDPNDVTVQRFLEAKAKRDQIARYFEQMPEKKIPEIDFLDDEDWMIASRAAKLDTDIDVRKALSELRSRAKNNLPMGRALYAFVQANNGQLPSDLAQLKPYFTPSVTDSSVSRWRGITSAQDDGILDTILARYKLLHTGKVSDFPPNTWFIAEKAPVDKEYDTRIKFGPGTSTITSTGLNEAGDPDDKSY